MSKGACCADNSAVECFASNIVHIGPGTSQIPKAISRTSAVIVRIVNLLKILSSMSRSQKTIFVRHNGRAVRVAHVKPSHEHHRSQSHLLCLPTELRQQIYEYVLEPSRSYDITMVRPPTLALVSRQLFREVSSAFLKDNRFRVRVHFNFITAPPKNIHRVEETFWTSAGLPKPWCSSSAEVASAPLGLDVDLQDPSRAGNPNRWMAAIFPQDSVSKTETETTATNVSTPTKICVNIPEWKQRSCLTHKKATSGRQAWLRVLGDLVQFRHVVFEASVDPGSGPKLVIDTNLDAKLMCFGIVTTPSLEAQEQRDWPCTDNTDRKAEQKQIAYEGVKQRLELIADDAIRRGRPLGFTLTEIEDMVNAFDVSSKSD